MQELQKTSEAVVSPSPPKSLMRVVWSWVRLFFILGVILIIINNLIGLERVSGHSMNPTLGNGDVLFLNKAARLFKSPKYGDVVVMDDKTLGYSIVKRIIAVAGDHVIIKNGIISVNGSPLTELYTYGKSDDMAETVVQPSHVFVVGDNREPGASLDSRDPKLGQIEQSEIKGFVVCSIWPMHGIAKPLM